MGSRCPAEPRRRSRPALRLRSSRPAGPARHDVGRAGSITGPSPDENPMVSLSGRMAEIAKRRTMPAAAIDEPDVLPAILEESLLFGRGARGTAVQLRTLDDWKRTWSQWRSIVLPKSLLVFPGRRPFACYVTGELPPRPMWGEPPLNNRWLRLYVPDSDGTGEWHHDYPEPWQENETAYLWRTSVIDADELQRARACDYPEAVRSYHWEQGRPSYAK